jgi:hypothetical protein
MKKNNSPVGLIRAVIQTSQHRSIVHGDLTITLDKNAGHMAEKRNSTKKIQKENSKKWVRDKEMW